MAEGVDREMFQLRQDTGVGVLALQSRRFNVAALRQRWKNP
jgi:hypothetical protein